MVRQGPQGELQAELARLRHLVLCEGLLADSDGMVCSCPLKLKDTSLILI